MKRGGQWEAMLDIQHDDYRRDGVAWVAKTNPSFAMVGGRTVFSKKAPPDYLGILPQYLAMAPRMVAFDAKSTKNETWSYGKLELHQAKDFTSIYEKGGICFLAIQYPTTGIIVLWQELMHSWWEWHDQHRVGSRKPIPFIHPEDGWFHQLNGADWLPVIREVVR